MTVPVSVKSSATRCGLEPEEGRSVTKPPSWDHRGPLWKPTATAEHRAKLEFHGVYRELQACMQYSPCKGSLITCSKHSMVFASAVIMHVLCAVFGGRASQRAERKRSALIYRQPTIIFAGSLTASIGEASHMPR
eukprot:4847188-Amphidinium_carterae.1